MYDLLEHIPYLGIETLYHLLCILYVVRCAVGHQLLHDEGLEELYSHLLGQSALPYLQLGAYDYNGTSRIVHTLTQQVLPEAAALTLEHVGK